MNDPSAPPTGPNDQAKGRFIAIQAMRWVGTGLVLVGLLIVNRKINLPEIAGYVMVVVGLVDALIVPTILAGRWKSPRQ